MMKRINTSRLILATVSFLLWALLPVGCAGKPETAEVHEHAGEHAMESGDNHEGLNHEGTGIQARADSPADPHNHSGEAAEHGSTGLRLTPEQEQHINLRLARASQGAIHKRISIPGEITLDQDSFIRLVPRISGIVSEVMVTRGDRVSPGQVLAVLESPEIGKVKAEFLEACQESSFQKAEMERFRGIQANTGRLLDLLDSGPEITAIDQSLFGDMGDYGSSLISSYADYTVARKAFERRQALFEKRISSEKDFLAARGAYEGSRAEYLSQLATIRYSLEQEQLNRSKASQAADFRQRSAASRLKTLGMTGKEVTELAATLDDPAPVENGINLTSVNLRAPRGGTILERLTGPGEKAEADTTLFTLADLDQVWASLKAPARDLAYLRTGQKVEVTSESGTGATGIISVVGPLVSEDTRTAEVRVILDNRSGEWKPGIFVRGFIDLPESESRLVIPREALQNINGENFVFVPSGDGYITAPVIPGLEDGSRV